MKISDLDVETKTLIWAAHTVLAFPTKMNVTRFVAALKRWDDKHQEEREENLFKFLGSLMEETKD